MSDTLNLNMFQANKTTLPITIRKDSIEWMKPFLIDQVKAVEGTQIRTSSGDLFVVVETYHKMRVLMGHEQDVVAAAEVILTEPAPPPSVPVTAAADRVFGTGPATTSAGMADPAAIDK